MSKARRMRYMIEDGARGTPQPAAQGDAQSKPVSLRDWLEDKVVTPMRDAVQAGQSAAAGQATPAAKAGGTGAGGSGSDYEKIRASYRELAERQLDDLDVRRTESRREASVLADRLTRYLPYLRRSDGTEGSGLADSADIGAYNQLLNRYAAADADYAQKQADTLASYRQTVAAMDREEVDRNWQSAENEAARKWQEDQTAAGSYADAANALGGWFEAMAGDSGKISAGDLAQLQAFADAFKKNLSAADGAQLDVLLSGYKSFVRNDTEQAVYDKQRRETEAKYKQYLEQESAAAPKVWQGSVTATVPSKASAGKNFTVTLDGTRYDVQIREVVEDEDVMAAAQTAGYDNPFILNGRLYMMSRGGKQVTAGTVFELEARHWDAHGPGALNGDDYTDLFNRIKAGTLR